MFFTKEWEERVRLLEYENELLRKEIKLIKEKINIAPSIIEVFPDMIKENGHDVSYEVLRKKYRKHTCVFEH